MVEEMKGPVPRPRSYGSLAQPARSESEQERVQGLLEEGRHVTHTVVEMQEQAERYFRIFSAYKNEVNEFCRNVNLKGGEGLTPDAFDVLGHIFNFQEASVRNQRDNATSMLSSRLSRICKVEDGYMVFEPTQEDKTSVLRAFRDELLSNYNRWCGFIGVDPISFKSVVVAGGIPGNFEEEYTMAMESALVLLIWGEAGNLRFCPEFLCYLYHKFSALSMRFIKNGGRNVTVPSYLGDIIIPVYKLLREQLKGTGRVIDHTKTCNYDDFNEIFWQDSCLEIEVAPFNEKRVEAKFKKTFMERQSWFVPIFSFWRVYMLHFVGLHWMIVGAKCELSGEEDDDDENIYSDDSCDALQWFGPAITLYAAASIRDLWDVSQAIYVVVGQRAGCGQFLLNSIRAGCKCALTLLLVVTYASNTSLFVGLATVLLIVAIFLETIMVTELWWGINSYGNWWGTTGRTWRRGGFAACFSSSYRQKSWALVGSMLGINSVNLYTQIHSLPPHHKRIRYIFFWALVLGTKISFSYFVVIKELVRSTYVIYNASSTEYDLSILGWDLRYTDTNNTIYVAALWAGSGLIFFLDLQIWFVVWANIAAAVEGVRRRVGEVNTSTKVVRAFSDLHKKFFTYMNREWYKTTRHTRFAHIWNEIVDAMREEDIISYGEKRKLRYFLVQLRIPKSNKDVFDQDAEVENWNDPLTLLPEFLMSGAVQRAVEKSKDFGKMLKKELNGLGDSRKVKEMRKFLEDEVGNGEEQVTTEMIRQLSVTLFSLLDALCRDAALSRSWWNLHRAIFPVDVGQPGKGIARVEGLLAAFRAVSGRRKDFPAVMAIMSFIDREVLFNIEIFEKFVLHMSNLVKALLVTPNKRDWEKNVAEELVAMITTVDEMFHTYANSPNALLELLWEDLTALRLVNFLDHRQEEDVRDKLRKWKAAFADRKSCPGALALRNNAEEFLRRTELFLLAPANSQPGIVKGAEARRRITFFVNSLYTEQPERKRVVHMPSLTTLTPYYKEEVVSAVEAFRKETEDGVTVLEYLRSIYPDEFANFAERIQERCRLVTEGIPVRGAHENETLTRDTVLEVDMMQPMIDGVVDPELSGKLDRDKVVKNVEKRIRHAVEKKLRMLLKPAGASNDDSSEIQINSEDVEAAVKNADVDGMVLELQLWASYRGQTLSRTVRGIMYYYQAVRLLAAVENIEEFQPEEGNYIFGTSKQPNQEEREHEENEGPRNTLNNLLILQGSPGSPGDSERSGIRRNLLGLGLWNNAQSRQSTRRLFQSESRLRTEEKVPEEVDEAKLDEENQNILESENGAPHSRPSNRRGGRGGESTPEMESQAQEAVKAKVQSVTRRVMASIRNKERVDKVFRQFVPLPAEAETDFEGFIQVKDPKLDKSCAEYLLTKELADSKFRYVVSCQVYGDMLKTDKVKAAYITMLSRLYPGLHISYVDTIKGKVFSVLLKYNIEKQEMEEEYRIQLPGPILVGEGKPNNQNHAIVFTRGEAVQAIDMNQDAALEDAIKIRQVMEEFNFAERGKGIGRNIGRIVGFREHVFTHDVSAVANFFSLQELNFVAATQRVLDNPLHIRFHYGHPDVFDRVSAITLGGISKPCKGLHLSEDIFAGFNYVLRGGESTQVDYIQVAKGRDTGVAQVTGFTAKISMGNGMQARSREVYRIAAQLDIFRLLSFYYSSVGGFMNQVLLTTAVFLYMYSKLYIVFDEGFTVDSDVSSALSTQFLFQLGFLLILPIPLLLSVEQGLQRAFGTLFNILVRLAPFFFIFSAGTNSYFVNSAIQQGQAEYKATGRGFVIEHERFVGMFRLYLASHFNIAFELLVILIIYAHFSSDGYILETFSVYLFVIGLLYTPVVFNPNGLDFTYASQDFSEWGEWMDSPVPFPEKSWIMWFSDECEVQYKLPLIIKIGATIRRCRLLILVYGFLAAVGEATDGGTTGDDWPGTLVVGSVLLIATIGAMFPSWVMSWGISQSIRRCCCRPRDLHYSEQRSRWGRLLGVSILVGVIVGLIVLASVEIIDTFMQIVYGFLAFIIMVYFCAQLMVLWTKDALRSNRLVRLAFKSVHMGIGLVIMIPILVLSFLPISVALQTRLLFNENFSSRFDIAKIFARQRKRNEITKVD